LRKLQNKTHSTNAIISDEKKSGFKSERAKLLEKKKKQFDVTFPEDE